MKRSVALDFIHVPAHLFIWLMLGKPQMQSIKREEAQPVIAEGTPATMVPQVYSHNSQNQMKDWHAQNKM